MGERIKKTGVAPRHHALGLDALRGLAALVVVLYHVGLHSGAGILAPIGYLAVDFFFMLSGFVVALAYEEKLGDGRLTALSFMRLRLIRLYPAILLGLLLGLVLRLTGLVVDEALAPGAVLAFLLLPNLATFVLYPLNNPMWSLFYEICANALHPHLIRRFSNGILVAIVIVAGLSFVLYGRLHGQLNVGWGHSTIAGGFLRIVYGYLFGVLVLRLTRAGRLPSGSFPGWGAPLLILLLIIPWYRLWNQGQVERVFALSVCPLALLCGLNLRAPARLESLFRFLGRVSYPLYAIHMPLLQLAEQHFPSPYTARGAAGWTLWFIAVIVLAATIEKCLERPLLQRLRPRR